MTTALFQRFTTKNITPELLLVVTFTTKAARELTTRISNRLNALNIQFNLNEMYLGTFHSICLRLLEENREFTRLRRNFTLFDQFDQQFFVYQKLFEYRKIPDYELLVGARLSPWRQSAFLMAWVNRISEETMNVSALSEAPEPEVRVLAECFRLYQQHLHDAIRGRFSKQLCYHLRLELFWYTITRPATHRQAVRI